MELMKSLLSDGTLEESVSKLSGTDVIRWKKRRAEIDRALLTLESVFKENSQFSSLVKDLGGDMGAFKACAKAVDKLVDEWEELEMHVGMTIQNDSEED